jgi:hypothetical protein
MARGWVPGPFFRRKQGCQIRDRIEILGEMGYGFDQMCQRPQASPNRSSTPKTYARIAAS